MLQLLCALIGLEAQMPQSAAQYKAAVYLLALRLGVLDSKSPVPAVASISDSEDANAKHAVLVSCWLKYKLPTWSLLLQEANYIIHIIYYYTCLTIGATDLE